MFDVINLIAKPWSYTFVVNAGIELVFLSVTLGVVGTFGVLRGMAFFSHSISHVIFPGLVVAFLMDVNLLVAAVVMGGLVAVVVGLTATRPGRHPTTTTAALYTGLFAVGIVMVSALKASKRLSELLVGRLFGVGPDDLWLAGLLGGGLLIVTLVFRKEIIFASFDEVMARASGLPVRTISLCFYGGLAVLIIIILPAGGNLLSVALLVTPAATARLITRRVRPMTLTAVGMGLGSSLAGLYLAYYLNLPAGPAIIAFMSLLFLGVFGSTRLASLIYRINYRST